MQKKNLLIAFSGPDGSGKTTLAKKLAENLKKKSIKLKLIHAHGYTVSQKSFGMQPETVRRWRYFLRFLIPLALLDQWFTYLGKYKPILKNKTLICDRYFYDKLVRMRYYGISNQTLSKIYLKLLPRPDFIFLVDSRPEKILKRKKEYQKKELERFRKIYLALAKNLKAPVIDTSQPIKDCLKQIVKQLK